MTREEIKNNVSVSSRLEHITDKEKLKIIDFIIDYSFIDKKEIYTNGSILVPLFRVLDAIAQSGKQYESCEPEHQREMKEQHTPGPWNHDEYGHICAGPQIIGIAYQHELDDSDNDPLPCLPNARLMAAAPEMFDALRDLYNSSVLQSIPFDTAWQKAITLYEKLTDE